MSSAINTRKPVLEASLSKLLNNNFDSDSLTCIQTCLKVVDNILQKPGNEKVRSIRYQNQAMQNKIISKQGGVDILYSCGFVLQENQQLLAQPGKGEESFLVLPDQNEDTEWLVHVRHTLAQVAVHQLKCKPDMLPKFQQPTKKVAVGNGTSFGQGFNVYQGSRFDGQSAAVGKSLGPPKGWKSATETQLESLEKKQARLAKKHQVVIKERNWVALRPGEVMNPPSAASAAQQSTTATTTSSREDSALIAGHIQKQQKRAQEEANRGFTTKAMRDLEKIKKQKVYSHTILAISFPDGCTCKGQFLPAETVNSVMESIRLEVLSEAFQSEEAAALLFELYITPPRTKLLPHQTLTELDLVPAAKVFVSWKSPAKFKGTLAYINSDLFQSSGEGPSMPAGVPVLTGDESSKPKAASAGKVSAPVAKKKKSKAERQAEMLKRMMGK